MNLASNATNENKNSKTKKMVTKKVVVHSIAIPKKEKQSNANGNQ